MDKSEKEPLVHCKVVQNRLKQLNLVADNKTIDRILARISKTTLETVQRASENSWIPLILYAEINDAIAAEVGEEGVYNLSYRSFTKFLESSVVSPFFRSAMNLVKV